MNAIYPAWMRDALLRAAEAGLYKVYFSRGILCEMSRNVLLDYPIEPTAIDRTIHQMVAAFEEGLVEDYES